MNKRNALSLSLLSLLLAVQARAGSTATMPAPDERAAELAACAEELDAAGETDPAVVLMEEALAIRAETHGWGHPAFASTAAALAEMYLERGEFRGAAALLEHGLAIREGCAGAEHPETAAILHQLGAVCQEAGWLGKAESHLVRALDIRRRILGDDSLEVAATLRELSALYGLLRRPEKQLTVQAEALGIYEKEYGPQRHLHPAAVDAAVEMFFFRKEFAQAEALLLRGLERELGERGEDDLRVAELHETLGVVYQALRQPEATQRHLERALEIREQLLGPQHYRLRSVLANLVRFYQSRGRFEEALSYQRRYQNVVARNYDRESIHRAEADNGTGILYHQMGRLEAAVEHFKRALEALEPFLGTNNARVKVFRVNIAAIYAELGRFDDAEVLLRGIVEEGTGEDILDRTYPLSLLADLYRETGRYREAEPLFLKAKAIFENEAETESEHYRRCISGLGDVYRATARTEEAEELYRRALASARRDLFEGDPVLGSYLGRLAGLLARTGRRDEAERLCAEQRALWERVPDPDHPVMAGQYFSHAVLYEQEGRLEQAEALFRRAFRIMNGVGEHIAMVGDSLHRLGLVYARLGRPAKAEEMLREALAIRRRSLGPQHPKVAPVADHLAALMATQGRYVEAHALFADTAQGSFETREQVFSLLGESQKLAFVRTQESGIHRFVGNTAQHLAADSTAVAETWNAWLRWKGAVLEAHGRHLDAVARSENPEIRRAWQALRQVRREFAGIWLVGYGNRDRQELEARLASLGERQKTLEAELSRLSREFAFEKRSADADSELIASLLPPGAVYLDFARIDDRDFATGELLGSHYAVFVLGASAEPALRLVDLGAAEGVDRTVEEYLARIRERAPAGTLEPLARSLYDRLLGPVAAALRGRDHLLISPDGALHLVPFEALRSPNGDDVIDSCRVSYLAAGRDLLRWEQPVAESGVAVVMADPNYDLDADEREKRIAQQGVADEALRGAVSRNLREMHFQRLPGAREEGAAVSRILRERLAATVVTYTGDQAIEEALWAVRSPRVLHLATHGFFLRDTPSGERPDDQDAATGLSFPPHPSPADAENPLLRSGIALAGANTAIAEGRHEGLVSAAKIIGLDVRGTDLVVLSACDTARGDIRNGEGVFGLQRAFMYAGARTLVMTRWQVEDEIAKQLMTEFYRLWSTGLPKAEALRQAKRKLRAEHPHPCRWAAAFLVGNPQ